MFECLRKIRYSDLDASGSVYFANFVRYMEEAEYAWLRSRGLSVVLQDERGSMGFPRLSAEFEVVENVNELSELSIGMDVEPSDGKRLIYRFNVRCAAQLVATGKFVVACCRFPADDMPYAIPIPEWVLDKMFGVTTT
jgi:YbgC/YbaW family acyl-CoA thioester hydrolase